MISFQETWQRLTRRLDRRVIRWPRKHEYTAGYPSGFCIHCKRRTGLDLWQLKSAPRSMEKCKNGRPIKIIELITGNFDVTYNAEITGGEAVPLD